MLRRTILALALAALVPACGGSSSTSNSVPTGPLSSSDTDLLAQLAVKALLTETGNTPSSTAPTIEPVAGEQRVLVILVNFKDSPNQPWTVEQARQVVFEETDAFLRASSNERTWLTGDVAGWFTLPMSSMTKDARSISDTARNAARAANVPVDTYPHLVIAFPHAPALPFQGEGTIGGSPTIAWANGVLDRRTVAHELGHNLGLRHARALTPGSLVAEYGCPSSVMGSGDGDFTAPDKVRLGWMRAEEISNSGTYQTRPIEEGGPALRIPRGSTVYWVEARRGVPGVLVRIEDPEGDLLVATGTSFRDEITGLALTCEGTNVSVLLDEPTGGREVVDLAGQQFGSRELEGAMVLDYRRDGPRWIARATLSDVRVGAKPAMGALDLDAIGGGGTVTGSVNGSLVASFPFSFP